MSAIGFRTRAIILRAGLIAACLAAPPSVHAQGNEAQEAAAKAAAVARADTLRAALVQPPGRKSSPAAAIVRAPFRVFTGALALVGGAAYGVYELANHFGLVAALRDTDRELEAIDIKLRPDFIGTRSGLGLSARWNGSGTPLFLEGGYSARGYQLARGGLSVGDTLYGLEAGAGWHKLTQLHFWGIGPDSRGDDRSDYGYDRRDVSAEARARLFPHVRVMVDGGWEDYAARRGNDAGRPDLLDTFAGRLPYGAVGSQEFGRLGGALDLDFSRVVPSGRAPVVQNDRLGGARALLGWSGYRGRADTDSEFQIGSGDLRVYLPVSNRHEIGLRGMGQEVFAEEGAGVPFYLLPRLGSTEGLRGLRGWRLRDRALLAGMAEWRYRVWWHPGDPSYRVDAFVFVDHGAVGSSIRDIESDDFETTPGIGLRFLDKGIAQGETFFAFGGEDARVSLKLRASF